MGPKNCTNLNNQQYKQVKYGMVILTSATSLLIEYVSHFESGGFEMPASKGPKLQVNSFNISKMHLRSNCE